MFMTKKKRKERNTTKTRSLCLELFFVNFLKELLGVYDWVHKKTRASRQNIKKTLSSIGQHVCNNATKPRTSSTDGKPIHVSRGH